MLLLDNISSRHDGPAGQPVHGDVDRQERLVLMPGHPAKDGGRLQCGRSRPDDCVLINSNRTKGSGGWGAYDGVTLDSNGQLTSNTTNGASSTSTPAKMARSPARRTRTGKTTGRSSTSRERGSSDLPSRWLHPSPGPRAPHRPSCRSRTPRGSPRGCRWPERESPPAPRSLRSSQTLPSRSRPIRRRTARRPCTSAATRPSTS